MRDANLITDLLFTIDDVEYSVNGVYVTPNNLLYVKLLHPTNEQTINFRLGDIDSFARENQLKLDAKPNTLGNRDLINYSILKDKPSRNS